MAVSFFDKYNIDKKIKHKIMKLSKNDIRDLSMLRNKLCDEYIDDMEYSVIKELIYKTQALDDVHLGELVDDDYDDIDNMTDEELIECMDDILDEYYDVYTNEKYNVRNRRRLRRLYESEQAQIKENKEELEERLEKENGAFVDMNKLSASDKNKIESLLDKSGLKKIKTKIKNVYKYCSKKPAIFDAAAATASIVALFNIAGINYDSCIVAAALTTTPSALRLLYYLYKDDKEINKKYFGQDPDEE